MTATRRLAAILAADVAGYSRLIGADEGGTLQALNAIRAELIDLTIAAHNGRLVKTTGDGLLVEFGSVVDALRCAAEVQAGMAERNATIAKDRRVEYRVGIHQGDILVEEDGDLFGDGVNIAARLEALAEPGGICASARVQEDAAGKLDLVFEDLGEQALKNIARPVRAYRVAMERRADAAKEPAPLPLPDKPSIAVLPFQNMSGDPEQEYFADGMVEEIITALSRIRWLFVIARNSTFTYKGQAIDVKRVGRELGVRYVLEGSVRKGGGRVRITAQLIEAETGAHLWADRFDGSLEDVFELQEQVAISVAGVIEPALQAAETARSANRPTSDLTAYDLYAIRPGPRVCGGLLHAIGQRRLRSRSERDSAQRHRFRTPRPGGGGERPGVLADAAYALACFGEDIDAMIVLVDRALAFNPSYARGWHASGFLRLWAGQTDLAIEHAGRALRLSPRAQARGSSWLIGAALFFSRRFEEAVPRLWVAIEDMPVFPTSYRFLAACYAHMGLLDEARATIARLRAFTSEVIPNYPLPFRDRRHCELYLSGLRLAAGDTT